MFTCNVRKLWRKAFGSWVTAVTLRPQPRPSSRPSLEELETRLVPALWYVDGLGDLGQGRQNPQGGGGQGDLRFCMIKAVAKDTIVFGVSGTISLNSQLPAITQKNLTIDGSGQNVEIWGGGTYRIFTVNAGATAEIDNLSIDDGFTAGFGGGLNNAGTLTLKNDTFLSNQATQGGGAIYNAPGVNLTMENVSVNSNSTAGNGGGIFNDDDATVSCSLHCSIVQNKANGGNSNGGGIMNDAGFVQLLKGTQLDNNSATINGGGAYNTGGNLGYSIAGSKSASVGIQYNSAQSGGGLYINTGQVTITGQVFRATNKMTYQPDA